MKLTKKQKIDVLTYALKEIQRDGVEKHEGLCIYINEALNQTLKRNTWWTMDCIKKIFPTFLPNFSPYDPTYYWAAPKINSLPVLEEAFRLRVNYLKRMLANEKKS